MGRIAKQAEVSEHLGRLLAIGVVVHDLDRTIVGVFRTVITSRPVVQAQRHDLAFSPGRYPNEVSPSARCQHHALAEIRV